MSNWWCLKNTDYTDWEFSACEPFAHKSDPRLSIISKIPPITSFQEVKSNLNEPWSSCRYALMETPANLRAQAKFPVKQCLDEICNMHPQIIPWENESTLQALSNPKHQVPLISSSSESFDVYQVAQILTESKSLEPAASNAFIEPQVIAPPSYTNLKSEVKNVESIPPPPTFLEDWLINPDENLLGENETVPVQSNSNRINELHTLTPDLLQMYCAENNDPMEDNFNYQNNFLPSNPSMTELVPASVLPDADISTATDRIPEYENEFELISHNWPNKAMMHKYDAANILSDINLAQTTVQECLSMKAPLQSPLVNYVDTTQSNFRRENPRVSRNKAEKQRRDKLNQSIAELSYLVPQVANANRKLDKTSILRLSAHYLRSHNYVFRDVDPAPKSEFKASSVQAALSLLNGFLLITTYKGIVVVVSHNVSEYLGYNEVDLLGYNILNIIHEDDRNIMTEQLTPKTEMLGPNGELLISGELNEQKKVATQLAQDKRKFNVRFKRIGQRYHPGQYVSCCVEGSFRKSDRARGFIQRPMRRIRARVTNPCSSGNDIVFIGIVRPIATNIRAENRIESFHTEYMTTHSIDGEIIKCDQRISLATGYMTQEVIGINAMNFIHRDDVRWVVIALQEMYDKCSMFSESYYRLMIKNGQFIHMRTRGYLQVDDSASVVNYLVCQNTIIEEEEAEPMLKMMRNKYSVKDNQNKDNPDEHIESPKSPVAVVDPKDLLKAVFGMLQNLSQAAKDTRTSENCISTASKNSSPRLTYKQPKKERIISAIQKMYSFIKTFQEEIQQAQKSLHNQRSLTILTKKNQQIDIGVKTNVKLSDVNEQDTPTCSSEVQDIFQSNANGKVNDEKNSVNPINSGLNDEVDEESHDLPATIQEPIESKKYFKPLQNKQNTFDADCIATENILQNVSKVGVKRSNEYIEQAISKKKVIDKKPLDEKDSSPLVQDRPLDNYFTEEDLQRHIDLAINEAGQEKKSSLADLIDFDEFLKNFEK